MEVQIVVELLNIRLLLNTHEPNQHVPGARTRALTNYAQEKTVEKQQALTEHITTLAKHTDKALAENYPLVVITLSKITK